MFRKVYIENFRCFQKLKIEGLKNFNLILGRNNVGKTALLEALFFHGGSHNPAVPQMLDTFRGILSHSFDAESLWSNLFFNLDISKVIKIHSFDHLQRKLISEITLESTSVYRGNSELSSKRNSISTNQLGSHERIKFYFVDTNKKKYTSYATLENGEVVYKKTDSKHFMKGMFISTRSPLDISQEAQRFGNLQIEGRDQGIIDSLKVIEPRLQKLIVAPVGNRSVLFADIGFRRAVEVNYLGEGILRLLQILLAMTEAEKGIIFIDEIERGFHYTFYESAIKVIMEFARQIKAQIFATSHSVECLKASYNHFRSEAEDDILVIRLNKVDEIIQATTYNFNELEEVIEGNWEIR